MLYDLIIIGGGPAGITAGIYAARKRLKTLLITKDFLGQVAKTSQVANWPGTMGITGMDLSKSFEKHLKQFEIEVKTGDKVVDIKKARQVFLIKTEQGKEFSAKIVIVAAGSEPRHLGVSGEKHLVGRGVAYCSVCDAPFFKNKNVVVVGGGNAGFEAGLDLVKYAKRISILERGNKASADEFLQEQAKKQKKITVFFNKQVQDIKGKDKVQAIVYYDLLNKKTYQMPVDGVFIEIGSVPVNDFLNDLVEFNERGEIKVDKTGATSVPGIFAAGDVCNSKYKQIVAAAGQGCQTALAAYEYLRNMNYENSINKS